MNDLCRKFAIKLLLQTTFSTSAAHSVSILSPSVVKYKFMSLNLNQKLSNVFELALSLIGYKLEYVRFIWRPLMKVH